jgi:hypothetical protein
MLNRAFPPRRDRTAIVLSIALHCCVLAFVATIAVPAFSPDVQDERTLLAGIIRIEHRMPPRIAEIRPATPPPPAQARPVDRPILRVARSDSRAARALVAAAERRFSARSTAAPAKAASPVAPAPIVVAAAHARPIAAATATPTPSATATPAPVAALPREAGIGNFGEDYPAKVDPQSRGGLFAGINDAVQLRVTVDESGHAVAIEFVRAPADPAMVQELRNRLLAAHFIPAACNGLRCAGTVELRN